MIIHLNGWPGAGKKTIGSILAGALGARFIHNHVLHDVAIVCAGVDTAERWIVYEQVRAAAYEGLLKRPVAETFVLTNALCKTAPRELKAWQQVVELAMARQVPLIPVVLEVEAEENLRRVQSADRVGRKMSDPAELRSYFATDTLQYPDVPETIVLDVTHLGPPEAASEIRARIQAIAPGLGPATRRHLRLR